MSELVPMFSVITPVFNRSDSIKNAVQSVLAQDYTNWEHIIVDDGSTDGTSEYLDCIQARDSRIKVIHQQNRGVSAARNAGLQNAAGQYVLFLDSDDAFVRDAFYFLSKTLKQHSDLDMIIYESKRIKSCLDGDCLLNRKEIRETFLPGLIGAEPPRPNRNYRPIVWNKCTKRSLIQENKIVFDVNKQTWEDREFAIKMIDKCNTVLMTQQQIIVERTIDRDDHLSLSYYPDGALNTAKEYEWLKNYFQHEYDFEGTYFLNHHFHQIQTWIWRAMSKDQNRKKIVMTVLKFKPFQEIVQKRSPEGLFETAIKTFMRLHMYAAAYRMYWLQNVINRGECF